jgi:hypothetical protein
MEPPNCYLIRDHRYPLDELQASIPSISPLEAFDLLRQGLGNSYFVPAGYIPILVPAKEKRTDQPERKKKPRRTPNAFILYRTAKYVRINRPDLADYL